jgi:hypothetical protein
VRSINLAKVVFKKRFQMFVQHVMPKVRAVASLNNVELITALLSCNRQLAANRSPAADR